MDEEIISESDKKKKQQQQVKRQQIAIATSMKVSPDIISELETIEEWHIREWLYICAVDGMRVEQIKALSEAATIERIRKSRLDHWRDRCVGTDMLQKNLEKLQTEVLGVCEESRQARAAIEEGLDKALQREAAAQEETLRAKDELNAVLTKQVQGLKEQVRRLEQQPVEPQREKTEMKESARDIEMLPPITQDPVKKKKTSAGAIFSLFLQGVDTKKFIERYVKDEKMSPEQTEFLLECLEEGMSPKQIEAFASPGLPVDVMRRLKKIRKPI